MNQLTIPETASETATPAQMLAMAVAQGADPERLQKLLDLQERWEATQAKRSYTEAMNDAQGDMGRVSADATNPQTRSRYASYGKLDSVLRPIYVKHGFSLSFNEADSPKPEHVRVVCRVSHRAGHTEEFHTDMPADGKGAKGGDVMTKTHAVGAAKQYGMRYLLKGIFNVAIGDEDTDGNEPKTPAKPAPEGFDAWWATLEETAQKGADALKAKWEAAPKEFRIRVSQQKHMAWEILKADAEAVK
jgi:hypothetical protein